MVPEFTHIEQSGLSQDEIDESSIEAARFPSSEGANSSFSDASIPSVTVRRHDYPSLFPFLTLVRYLSTAYVSELVTEEFATPSIRHSCVSFLTF